MWIYYVKQYQTDTFFLQEVKAASRQKLDASINPRTDYKQMELKGGKTSFHRLLEMA